MSEITKEDIEGSIKELKEEFKTSMTDEVSLNICNLILSITEKHILEKLFKEEN